MTDRIDNAAERVLNRALTRRGLIGRAAAGAGALAAPYVLRLPRGAAAQEASNLTDYQSAKMEWRQADGQEIVLGTLEHPWTTAVEPLLPQFTELTGIAVNLQKASETEYLTKLPVTLAGGSPTPDVFMTAALGQAVEGKWLEPLDDYYANPQLTDLAWYNEDDIFGSARQFPVWQADGTRYVVSITAESETLFLRRDLMEAKGLEPPKTFDEYYTLATALKADGVAGVALRGKATADAVCWPLGGYIFSFSYGGQIIDEAGGVAFDSAEAVAAVEMYTRLLKDAGPQGVGNYHWYEVLTDFQQGKAATVTDSSNFTVDFEKPDASTVVGKVLYAPFPTAGTLPSKPNMWHWMAGMNAKSQHKEAAWLFLQWVTSAPTAKLIGRHRAAPARTSTWQDPGFRAVFGEQAAEAALANLTAADGAVMTRAWFHPKWPQVGEALAIAVNEVVTGGKDVQTALTEGAAKAREAME